MEKNKLLEFVNVDLVNNQLVVKFKNKTLGVIHIDRAQLEAEAGQSQSQPAQPSNPSAVKKESVKQYVEGCDMGWC